MYIHKIKLNNFKSFAGEHELEWAPGINFLIGNNNCGKTTIFKALEFIQSGKSKEEVITKDRSREDVSVEIELRGSDIPTIVDKEELGLKKYQDYVIDNNDGTYSLILLRSSEEAEVIKSKSPLTIKNIRVLNPLSTEKGIKRYENPTGIDRTISALFDPLFVYSDIHHEDYQDFGKTKVVGKIIYEITKEFQKEYDSSGKKTVWGKFIDAHNEAFGPSGVISVLSGFERDLSDTLKEQYGEGDVKFNFRLPEIDNFFKTGDIMLSDHGVETLVDQKGTGMQRALALSLIQVYAKHLKKVNNTIDKPLFFLIDEPETFLHPSAQNKLMDALHHISETSQIFITTHSPYFLENYDKNKHSITLFYRESSTCKAKGREMLDLFGRYSPTWGEINYYAFELPSVAFHNELYGFLQAIAIDEDENNYKQKEFDNWLEAIGIAKNCHYIHEKGDTTSEYYVTLPTLIRNVIHHPENTHNTYTQENLKESIEILIEVYEAIRAASV